MVIVNDAKREEMKFKSAQIVIMAMVSVILVLVVVPNLFYGHWTVFPGYTFIVGLGVGIVYAVRDEKKLD